MMSPGKSDVDPNLEQDMSDSETSTLSGTQDVYKPAPVPSAEIRGAPTNYLRVSKRAAPIREDYFIDLSIPPVPQSVPNVVAGIENFLLHANGHVTTNIWVTGNNKLRRVFMNLFSDKGHVNAKVHDAFSASETERRPSLVIQLRANQGVYLSLPRCFRGLITIQPSRTGITLSPTFNRHTALLSDVQDIRVYFVGDRPRSWTLWHADDDNKERAEAAESTVKDPEEPLDNLLVSAWNSTLQIYWDGEPGFPQ